MPAQIVIVLCEGHHDVAFIYRILKTIGFKSNENTKIGEYPFPMNELIANEVKKTDVEGLNITEIRRSFLPSNTLLKDNTYVFLYSMGGDSKSEHRQKVLKDLRVLIPNEDEIQKDRLPIGTTLNLLYFFDADGKGISIRLSEINAEVRSALDEVEENFFKSNASIALISNFKIGAFIFTGPDNNTGKLEDILLPLMKEDNESIFEDAHDYIAKHHDDSRLFPLKLELLKAELTENRSTKLKQKEVLDEKKSVIGIVGQLQKSGKSNVVCISDCDYLTLNKIRRNIKCQEIANFFKSFLES